MNIMFINFNIGSTPGINNGIAILSAVLKKEGHRVGLIFLNEELGYGFNLDEMRKEIMGFNPGILGISLIETQLKYAAKFCKGLRDYYKGFVICGGSYPTMVPEECLLLDSIDAVCVGEGEEALRELADALENCREYNRIKNLWFRQPDGSTIKNRLRPFQGLAELPPEDKEIFDLEKILPLKNYQLETMVSRGCPYQCSYCINQSYLKKYQNLCEDTVSLKDYVRMKKVGTAIREITDVISSHPLIKKIAFIDDNFILDSNFLEQFCQRYIKEIGMPFVCNANPLSYSERKAKILKNAGCDDVRFGVESGSERIKQEILQRPVSNLAVMKAFEINKKLGMMTSSFNMIGLPTETKEEVFQTLKLNALIMPDTVKVMTFYPFKNTPIYDLCRQHNLIDYDKKLELDNYDTFTCLKFPREHRLFLQKVQTAFNWYLNLSLENESSKVCASLIRKIEEMNETEWNRFDFYAVDGEISQGFKKKGVPHYSKFVNRSLAVKFPSRHFN